MLIVSALSNMGAWNLVSCELETQPSHNFLAPMPCSAKSCKCQAIPTCAWKSDFCGDFCSCNCETLTVCHKWTRWNSSLKQGSYSATDSTSWNEQACTHDTLWHRSYVSTSKEYVTNDRILLKYFGLVFFLLQLVKVLCKLITILSEL